MEITDKLRDAALAKVNANWCNCLEHKLAQLTPKKLAAYCEEQKYKPFPAPVKDDFGVRYQYFLFTHLQMVDNQEKPVNVVASFSDFTDFPQETLEGMLSAIKLIAAHQNKYPQTVVEEVVKMHDTTAKPTDMTDPDNPPPYVRKK